MVKDRMIRNVRRSDASMLIPAGPSELVLAIPSEHPDQLQNAEGRLPNQHSEALAVLQDDAPRHRLQTVTFTAWVPAERAICS